MPKLGKPLPVVSTRDAVLVSCVVWREKGNKFLSRDSGSSNAARLQPILESPQTLGDFLQTLVPEDHSLFDQMSERLTQELIQKKLSGTLNEFEQSVLSIINSESVTYKDAGKLAYLPEMFHRYQVKDTESAMFRGSQYVGAPGHKVEMEITLIRKKIFQISGAYSRYNWVDTNVSAMLICRDQNHNMIKIFHRDLEIPMDQSISIKARVKKHDFDQEYGVPSTILNYVKIPKTDTVSPGTAE